MERQELRRADLARRIGKNIPKVLRRFDNLLQTGNEPIILPRLVDALGIHPKALEVALRETEAELQAERDDAERRREQFQRDHFKPHVFVETDRDPMRMGGPLAAIIYRATKRIELPAEMERMLLWDQVDETGGIIGQHYMRHKGVLGPFGTIIAYYYLRTYDDTVRFLTTGEVADWFAKKPMSHDFAADSG